MHRPVLKKCCLCLALLLAAPPPALAELEGTRVEGVGVNAKQGEQSEKPYRHFYENPIAIYGREVRYDVFRNDKKIGQHTVGFDRGGDTLLVTAHSELAVRYFGVPVYHYVYRAKEIWVAGRLVSIESEIRDNRKKPRLIQAEVRGRVLEVTDRGKSRLAPVVEFATTHWHPGALDAPRVFHTTHGKVRHVRVENLGSERIALRDSEKNISRAVEATHYRLSGGFSAELWYDRQHRWLRLRFKADDGSLIDYRCSSCAAY